MEKNVEVLIEYKYFIQITNIDNQLVIRCGAEGDFIQIFPREGENNYFDNDIPLNIVIEITGSLQPTLSNKLRFDCYNGNPTPNGVPNPAHLRFRIYYEKYSNGVLQQTLDVVPFDNRFKDHQPSNSLVFVVPYTIVKQKSDGLYSFTLDSTS
jgi:hypothetical protein